MALKKSEEERIKPAATALNTVAGGSVVVGSIAPLVALALEAYPVPVDAWRAVAVFVAVFGLAVGLHAGARKLLVVSSRHVGPV